MQRGHFELPPSSEDVLSQWRVEVSPLASFSEECVVPGRGADLGEIRQAFNDFVRGRGGRPYSNAGFIRMVKNNPKAVQMVQYKDGYTFPGIALRLDAQRRAGAHR